MRLKADLLLFMVAVIWGTGFITQGVAARYQVAYLFNGVCFMLAAVILIPFIPRGTKISADQWKWMIIAGLILCFATGFQQVGLFYTKVANAGFLTSLYIVFTPFLLWVTFREKPHWVDLLAVFLAGVGAFFLSTAGRFEIQKGDALEVIGSIFWALHFVVLGKFATRFESASFASGHFFISGFINFLMGLFVRRPLNINCVATHGSDSLPRIHINWDWLHSSSMGTKAHAAYRRCTHSWAGGCLCCHRWVDCSRSNAFTRSDFRMRCNFRCSIVFAN